MKVGDLVRIKQGSRYGKLALVARIDSDCGNGENICVAFGCGDWFGYYRRDLEVISESR